jgi:hypothetical protein
MENLFDEPSRKSLPQPTIEDVKHAARKSRELEDKVAGFRFEDLAQNEQFVSAVLQATQAAVRTHQEEKIEALRNAVLNVAIGIDLSQDLRAIFLSFIDTFAPSHMRMLRFLQNRVSAPLDFDPRRERAFSDQLINDLNNRGLLKDGRAYAARGRDDSALIDGSWEVSAMGKQFLQFIAAP